MWPDKREKKSCQKDQLRTVGSGAAELELTLDFRALRLRRTGV